MRIARIKETKLPIEAEDLLTFEDLSQLEFICADENCGVALVPAAYKVNSKQRPHFRTLRKQEHSKDCKYSEFARILEIGGKRKITFEEFENLPVPTKLISPKTVSKDHIVKSNNTDLDGENEGTTRRFTNSGQFDESGTNFKSVTSISQIVDFYLSCPFNRDIELMIFDKTKAYMYWFKRLKNTLKSDEPMEYSIYFGQVHQDNNFEGDSIGMVRIKMYDCEKWENEKDGRWTRLDKGQINPFYVSIDTRKLGPIKKGRVMNELKFVRNEHSEAFKQGSKDKKRPFIFFVGKKRSKKENFEYEVYENQLVARYTEIRRTVID